jgi:hypothetical protein
MSFFEGGATVLDVFHTYRIAVSSDEAGILTVDVQGMPPFTRALEAGTPSIALTDLPRPADLTVDGTPLTLTFVGNSGAKAEAKYRLTSDYTQAYQNYREREGRATRRRQMEQRGVSELFQIANRELERFPVADALNAGVPDRAIMAFAGLYRDLNALDRFAAMHSQLVLGGLFDEQASGKMATLNGYWFLQVASAAAKVQMRTAGLALPITHGSVLTAIATLRADRETVKTLDLILEMGVDDSKIHVCTAMEIQAGFVLIDRSGTTPLLVPNPVFRDRV